MNGGVVEECFHFRDAFVVAHGFWMLTVRNLPKRGVPGISWRPFGGNQGLGSSPSQHGGRLLQFVLLGEAARFCCPSIIVRISSSEEI